MSSNTSEPDYRNCYQHEWLNATDCRLYDANVYACAEFDPPPFDPLAGLIAVGTILFWLMGFACVWVMCGKVLRSRCCRKFQFRCANWRPRTPTYERLEPQDHGRSWRRRRHSFDGVISDALHASMMINWRAGPRQRQRRSQQQEIEHNEPYYKSSVPTLVIENVRVN